MKNNLIFKIKLRKLEKQRKEEDLTKVNKVSEYIKGVVYHKNNRLNKLELQQLMFLVYDKYYQENNKELFSKGNIVLYRYGVKIEPITKQYQGIRLEDIIEDIKYTEEELKEDELYIIVSSLVEEYIRNTYLDLLLKSKSKYEKYKELIDYS